jgi:hypothetical protein
MWLVCPWCDRELFYLEVKPDYCRYCKKKITPTKLALKLQYIIQNVCNLIVEPYIHRLYPGYWQRSRGAFLWAMYTKNYHTVGSIQTATEISKSPIVSSCKGVYWTTIELFAESCSISS